MQDQNQIGKKPAASRSSQSPPNLRGAIKTGERFNHRRVEKDLSVDQGRVGAGDDGALLDLFGARYVKPFPFLTHVSPPWMPKRYCKDRFLMLKMLKETMAKMAQKKQNRNNSHIKAKSTRRRLSRVTVGEANRP